MKETKEYYIGYLRNPKQIITNGFDKIDEMQVILEKEYNEFRELALREKVYIMDKNQVFDGHQLYKSQAGLIGRLGPKLLKIEAIDMITNIRNNGMPEYITKLNQLIDDTREMYLKGEQEYLAERDKFASNFNVDSNTISDKTTFHKLH